MGLFDKIKDNAKTISIKAIESTREYDEEYLESQQTKNDNNSTTSNDAPKPEKPKEKVEQSQTLELSNEEFVETPVSDDKSIEEPKTEPKPEDSEVDTTTKVDEEKTRTSKITEVPKSEANKPKTNYTPHYKSDSKKKEIKAEVKDEPEPKKQTKPAIKKHIIDIAPKKPEDTVKKAMYARERATMAALSTQRRLSGSTPLYSTSYMNFKTRVFIDRIEYVGSFGRTVLPIDQVSWVKLRHGGTGIIIETTESKRVVLVIKPADRLSFADAIIKVQSMQPKKGQKVDNKTVRIDQLERFSEGIDEIEKIAKLFDRGIITQSEFDAKKKQILGI